MNLPRYGHATQHAVYALCEDPVLERAAFTLAGYGDVATFERWARHVLTAAGCAYGLDDADFAQVMELMRL